MIYYQTIKGIYCLTIKGICDTTAEKATNKEVIMLRELGKHPMDPAVEESVFRSLSRKKQLDERVDSALQLLNELDDEWRSFPEELNK